MGCVLGESGTDGQIVVRRRRVGGGFQVPLGLRFLHETLLIPILMYSSETMLWKQKERSIIRAVQMDNLRAYFVLGGKIESRMHG